jgi:hypothetical protein
MMWKPSDRAICARAAARSERNTIEVENVKNWKSGKVS